ncbi:hypothetical protein RvY_01126 [Ramazzottius varieornatus]|uniref:Uncharacterized protein n=1 Tax=Ramazzottius varieornatus TaxID=947166 RepID=A0A1D1UG39_RAMVA|nr:hypothetical protein RvY_01126 [Ramazzottius varieornatus]
MAVAWSTLLYLIVLLAVINNSELVGSASITGHLEELVRDIRATIDRVSLSTTGQRSSSGDGRRIDSLPQNSQQTLKIPVESSPAAVLWWDGSSVCVNRTKILDKSNETTTEPSPLDSSNSSGHAILTMCRIVGNKRHCRTRESVNGSNFEEFSTTYECCKGFVLHNNQECVRDNDSDSDVPLDDENDDDDTGTDNLLGRFLEESIRTQSLVLRALDAGAPTNEDGGDEQLMPVLVFKKKTLPTVQSASISHTSSRNATDGSSSSKLSSRSDLHFSVTI